MTIPKMLPRVVLTLAVVLMALSPLIGMASASIQPDTYANMKAYYGHMSPQQATGRTDPSGASSRSVIKFFDIRVSLGWDATTNDFNNWQNEITGANAKLYDGSDGQMAFRQVDIYNNKDHWNSVNVHINAGTGRSYTYRGGIDYPGQVFIEEYDQSDMGLGGKVLQHEFGHYGLYLPDEYTDAHGPFCTCTQGTTYDTNEWCCKNTHCQYDWSFCHTQGNGEALSCWEQIVQAYPQLTVKNPPVAGPYDAPTPKFVWHFPDLYTTNNDLMISPAAPKTGDQVTITLNVFNKENMLRSNVDVAFHDNQNGNDYIIGDKSMYVSDYATTFTYTWTATAGTHTLSAVINPSGIVKEITKANNTASMTIHVDAPPVISPSLNNLHTKEDQQLVVDLTKYGSDEEDAGTSPSMKWTVTGRDSKVITNVYGENSANHTLTFSSSQYFYGRTTVQLTLTDSVGLTAKKNVDLYWDFVNHRPWIDGIMLSNNTIFRTQQTMVTVSVKDIEDKISSMNPQLQYKLSAGYAWADIKLSLNGDAFTGIMDTQPTFATGKYDFRAMVTDSGSLVSDWYYLNSSFEVRNNPPVVQQVAFGSDVSNGVYRGTPVTLLVTATDKENTVDTLKAFIEVSTCGSDEWQKVDSTGDLQGDVWALTYIPPLDTKIDVTYCFQAYVIDMDNDSSAMVTSDELHVNNNLPVVSSISTGAKDVLRTKGIVLTVKGGDIENQPRDLTLEITYKVGSGNDEAAYISELALQPGGTDNNGTWTARFIPTKSAKLGDYVFSARLKDQDGKYGEWFTQTSGFVTVKNNDPTAMILPIGQQTAGSAGTFDATGSKDTEDTGLTYSWDFGDHATGNGMRTTHGYSSAGKYIVTLTVKDSDGGKTTATTTVDVKAASIFAGGGASGGGINMMLVIALILLVVIVIVVAVVLVSRRKKTKARELPPPQPAAFSGEGSQQPAYHVESFRVYDNEVQKEKVYGDEEMKRSYK